jgi:hypothetical protein
MPPEAGTSRTHGQPERDWTVMTERKPPGVSWESWVEQQIRQGQARGAFDNLPGSGKPLPRRSPDETVYDWVIEKARKENLDVFGMLPPGLALRKEREDLPRRAAALPSETAVRALVEDFNLRVEQHWRRPMDRGDVVPGMADLDAVLAHWHATRPPPEPVPPPVAGPPPRRSGWRFRRRRPR